MAIRNILNLPESLRDERNEYMRLFNLGTDKSSSGQIVFNSPSSGKAYTTVGTIFSNQGEVGMQSLLYLGDVSAPLNPKLVDYGLQASDITDIKNEIGTKVGLTGNETVAGIKTFSSSPIVPTPTTATQATNKGSVDTAISTAVAGKLNKTGDTMTGVLNTNSPINMYNGSTSTESIGVSNAITHGTGTYKITLPTTWNNAFVQLEINGIATEVNSNSAWKVIVTGYTAPSEWQYTSAIVIGNAPFSKVRLAHDGTKCCILLGELTTLWNYPAISVSRVLNKDTIISATGWTTTLITSEAGITVSGTPVLQGYEPTTTVITSGFIANLAGTIRLKKYSEGIVLVNFSLTPSATVNGTAYTLPVGYRPLYLTKVALNDDPSFVRSMIANTDGTLVVAAWESGKTYNGTLVLSTT